VRQQLHQSELSGGMTMVAERMAHLHSVAVRILIPAGGIHDPVPRRGLANLMTEMLDRGAGSRGSKQLSDAFETLGTDYSIGAGTHMVAVTATFLAENLKPAMALIADVIMRPKLPSKDLAAVKELVSQEIQALEEEPRRQVMLELSRQHFPAPFGNDPRGTLETVDSITISDLEKFHKDHVVPNGTIMGIAGNIEFGQVEDTLNELFGEWKPGKSPAIKEGKPGKPVTHVEKDSEQTHIALAFPSVKVGHSDYYGALGMVGILSGGMSGRLFTEVREKRGLCYACWATYTAFREHAAIQCYAGSTTARAQETLEVMAGELNRVAKNLTDEEIQRVKVGMRTSLFKQEDSSASRAFSLSNDWFNLKRVRPIEELEESVAGISAARIKDYFKKHPPSPMTLVSMGKKPLDPAGLKSGK
jgi:predicted Zn-dependent peptidase